MKKYSIGPIVFIMLLSAIFTFGCTRNNPSPTPTTTSSSSSSTTTINPAIGRDWHEITPSNITSRDSGASVALNDTLFLLGGIVHANEEVYTNEVLYTADNGQTWSSIIASWEPRSGLAACIYENEIWIYGGYKHENDSLFRDIWRSPNGTHWTQVTSEASALGSREGSTMIDFNGRLLFAGGQTSGSSYCDLWEYFPNDNSWNNLASFSGMYGSVREHNNYLLYTIGHLSFVEATPVLTFEAATSEFGTSWTYHPITFPSSYLPRIVLSFSNLLWILGGTNMNDESTTEVWRTDNFFTWTSVTPEAPWGGRTDSYVAEYNNKIWIIGGQQKTPGDSIYYHDIWYSPGD